MTRSDLLPGVISPVLTCDLESHVESHPGVGGHLTFVRAGVVNGDVQDVQRPQLRRQEGDNAVRAALHGRHGHRSHRDGPLHSRE